MRQNHLITKDRFPEIFYLCTPTDIHVLAYKKKDCLSAEENNSENNIEVHLSWVINDLFEKLFPVEQSCEVLPQ